MRWNKLGLVFDLRAHPLPVGSGDFAQSPQALVLDDRVRIFFSTRSREPDGQYLSHVAFVDMRKDLSMVLGVAQRPVIPAGALGTFDEHGIFPMNVLRHDGVVYGYTTGWSRRVSVSVETGIGLAVSRDEGLTFERLGAGPVLGATLNEPFLVADGFVRVIDGLFHMWYIFGTVWSTAEAGAAPERVYKIGHATSADGIQWTKEDGRRIVADRLGPDEAQALPCVFDCGTHRHMVFCYRDQVGFRTDPSRGYRIGHAWSDDLVDWTRDDAVLTVAGTPGEWDADMQCYPHVFTCEGATYLLYNGNAFGRFGFGAARLEP
ncbi:hypothetical protein [Methylorubrum extorquens]|uniref:Glycosylase n=1 Tax=Methylorubrum extorquens TaxID=408 RepID=A0AAX3WCZ3_METEX|nr:MULTISPECIES: hypothetical protein [Methylobacteriaceae]KQO86117.1 hypothetical protein ASF33_05610 [Methylobacterium sp. Leaf92]KQQ21565.1 hypothetical protein ASF56_18635 [Methylobacterium sp. Leaf122]WHQ68480.1 hypothetical protein KEC54_19115 [Methylorubrum extorquens]